MTSSSKSAAEGSSANASTAVNADAAPVKRYSLFTAICLIVGICIGSGIFFKSDNILRLTIIAAGGVNPENAGEYAAAGVDGLATTAPFTAKPIDMRVRMRRLG